MKGSGTEETLRHGSKPMGNAGLKSAGNKQGTNDEPMAESNVETLRHGSRPAPESVKMAQHNPKAQKRAHGFNERSQNGGAEKDGGW